MKYSYTIQESLDAALLNIRDKAIESGAIKHATPEFLQLVKEAEERKVCQEQKGCLRQ